jgi:RNA polymerase sigma-70 factor, ECF subfamily
MDRQRDRSKQEPPGHTRPDQGEAGAATQPEHPLYDDIVRAREGDQAAFESLYRARVGPISRYAAALVRDSDRAEDITAQTFLLAWRDLPKLREPGRFDAWLFRIAHNQAMSEISRRRPATTLDEAPELADTGRFGMPERELEAAAEIERVRDAVMRLPETQRQVLVLRYFQELPSSEIARQLGKNEQSVWSLTYRALQNLKRALADDAGAARAPRTLAELRAAGRAAIVRAAHRGESPSRLPG